MKKKILIITIISLIFDQVSKLIIENIMSLNNSQTIIKNFFYITLCHNKGAAWGLLSKYSFLIIIFSFIALYIIYSLIKNFRDNIRNILAFGLLIGGLLGNLIDRLFLGYVRDFLDFIIFKYDYPVFNVADICIVISVFLLIISIIKGDDKNENKS